MWLDKLFYSKLYLKKVEEINRMISGLISYELYFPNQRFARVGTNDS
jgi:hypothetical protein